MTDVKIVEQRKLLESLVIDNPNLEQLDPYLD